MVWRHLVGFVLAVTLASGALSAASSPTAEVTAALVEASKLMQKGGHAKAIETIDAALRSGKIPSELAAKALLMRAEANEKLERIALAYADYNSAVWMQALSASDSKRAEEGQARVMKKLGVAAPSNSGPARAEGRKAAPSRQATAVREQPSEERTGGTGGIGGFFNKLLSGVSGRSSEEPTATAAAVTELPAEESSGSKPQRQNNRQAAVSQDGEPAAIGSIKVSEKGNFAIQFAAVPDEEDKAIAEADRIARKYRDDLDGRTPSLMIVPTNDGGTLYKVVLAPFESRADGAAACETLKTRGLSCMVITKK